MQEKYWYQVTIQYYVEMDNGKIKTQKDVYLIHAISISDAEYQTIKNWGNNNDAMRIVTINETKISKVIGECD